MKIATRPAVMRIPKSGFTTPLNAELGRLVLVGRALVVREAELFPAGWLESFPVFGLPVCGALGVLGVPVEQCGLPDESSPHTASNTIKIHSLIPQLTQETRMKM